MPVLPPPDARRSYRSSVDPEAGAPSREAPVVRSRFGRVADDLLRQAVFGRLKQLRNGRLVLEEEGCRYEFGPGGAGDLQATVAVRDSRFYRQLVLGGSLGGSEAFVRGYWDCDDLVSLIRIFSRETDVSERMDRGPARPAAALARAVHLLRRNTPGGSRRNIAAHYDLGNDFFALFLDPTMTYSCGIFERADSSMEDASTAKYERICRKLQLGLEDHVLEIGCGWGGFAIHAAGRYGCRVTAATISPRQYELATRRVREAGLEDRVAIVLQDYRRLSGQYDKAVSIEMIEAVGHEYFETYFEACCRLLKPDGMMLLQAITIADQRYEAYRRRVDFIQQYVFPGGLLPSVEVICRSIARATDFRLFHLEEITPHYAETLSRWRRRFRENLEEIRRLGLPEELLRIWEFYFSYCEGGFRERMIGCVQMLLARQECRREPILPALG